MQFGASIATLPRDSDTIAKLHTKNRQEANLVEP